MEDSASFASKEALENSSKETAMAGMETAIMTNTEAPDSASSGQASKHAEERNLQKVLVVDTKTPAPHSQEKGV